MRRHGPPPRPILSYRDRAGAYGVLLLGRDVLLAAQGDDLLLPGGGIDPGETPIRALRREVFEETGWSIGPPRRIGVFARYDWLKEERYHARKIQMVFAARPARRLGPPVEHDHAPVWMDAREAVGRLSAPGEGAMLAKVIDRLTR